MYHSLNFEMVLPNNTVSNMKFNTYKDLFLVPTSRPVINPPTVKTKKIDIPGANGILDLTESLTPYPVFNNRTGSINFAVLNEKKTSNGNEVQWHTLYSKIMNMLHGRKARIILEDDPGWYYEGRWVVNNWASKADGTWSDITLDYDLYPYKLEISTSIDGSSESGTDRWKWSPFSFVDGVIYNLVEPLNWPYGTGDSLFKNIPVDSDDWVAYGLFRSSYPILKRDITGWMPVIPTITFSNQNMGIKVYDYTNKITYTKEYVNSGTYTDPQCVFYDWVNAGYRVYLKGHGTVTIEFRRGSL